jgi:GNAT superfamily N-acetyltransferase
VNSDGLSNITIHTFKNAYADSFKFLNLQWIEEFFIVEEEDLKILSNPKSYVIDKGGEIFFALSEGGVIGTSAMVFARPKMFELAKMSVDKTFQGQGVGRMLIEASITFAKEKGAKEIFLITNDKLIPALNLYKSSGFDVDLDYDDNRYERGNTKMKLDLDKGEKI